MTDHLEDPVQAAVEATFPLFEQNKDIPLLVLRIAEFSAQHIDAFRQVTSPAHPKLMKQADNLYAFIRKDCQDLTDMDAYFALMTACLKDIPLSPNIFDELIRELFSPKFEYLTDDLRSTFLQGLADNLISFDTLGICHAAAASSLTLRAPDQLVFDSSDQEKNTMELLHWICDSNDPLVFEILGEQALSHIFTKGQWSPVFDPASIALWTCIDHENRRVAGNLRNNRDDPQSKMVGWFERNQDLVVASVIQGTWSTKYHPNHIAKLHTHLPQLQGIATAMTLRSFDQRPAFLLDLMSKSATAPDKECIAIQVGEYNTLPGTATASGLEALMAYSLVYGDVIGDRWFTLEDTNPVEILMSAIETVGKHGEVIDQVAFETLATRSLSALRRTDDVGKIMRNELLKPFLRTHRHFQGIRLEQDLGM